MASPHPTRRFSDPLGTGPGRFLAIASALCTGLLDEKLCLPKNKRRRMVEIHENARKDMENERLVSPLEQYALIHSEIRNNADVLKRRVNEFYSVFVTGVSTDILARRSSDDLDDGALGIEEISSSKRGFSFYSDSNLFSTRIIGLEDRLRDIADGKSRDSFPFDAAKPRLYIVVGPFIAMGYYDGTVLKDLITESNILDVGGVRISIADKVDVMLDEKGKTGLGELSKSAQTSFQNPYYHFSESFFDGQKAARALSLPKDMLPSGFRAACAEYTSYNRFIASCMYCSLIELLTDQDEFLVFASRSSYAHSVMHNALKMAGRKMVDIRPMEGTFIPLDGEANRTAMNRVGGYLCGKDLGRRKSLTADEFFKSNK